MIGPKGMNGKAALKIMPVGKIFTVPGVYSVYGVCGVYGVCVLRHVSLFVV